MSEVDKDIQAENHDFTEVKPLYHTASHSKYLIKMHMIFVCKYRKKLLQGLIDEDIKQMFFEISKMADTSFSIEVTLPESTLGFSGRGRLMFESSRRKWYPRS
jgi:hypothetical protein